MAQHAQVALPAGSHPVNIVCFNNAATAIDANRAVLFEAVSGKPFAVALPGAGGGRAKTAGITTESIPAGGYGKVTVMGPAIAKAGEAIASGQKVMICDVAGSEGDVILASAAAATEELGTCLLAAAADNDLFVINVNPHTLPKSA
jgi:hypothetical protein